ncbi:MAG: hypothetical protein ORN98_00585 [Alphaproteobacteria bacterium]|nr:hypothetical protein [Alphaproteobacteria bacterium]
MAATISVEMLEKIAAHMVNDLKVMIMREGGDRVQLDRLVRMVYIQCLFKIFEILRGPADNKLIARQLTATIIYKLTHKYMTEGEILALVGVEDVSVGVKAAKESRAKPDSRKFPPKPR